MRRNCWQEASLIRIESLLRRVIGLSATSIGSTAIEIAVKTRMRQAGCDDFESYVQGLLQRTDEVRLLIEQIVVSETWFFRDKGVFQALAEHARSRVREQKGLSVLSIPCATGEEPYSVSMTLLESGMAPERYRIAAFDVSEQAVQAARRGVYGKNSFRGEPLGPHARFFDELKNGDLSVRDEARASVSLAQGNLLDSALLPASSQIDVVFCRNVLIYLDREARTKAFDNLLRWLTPDGILFAGHAEALDRMDPRFRRLDGTCNFAYGRRSEPKPEPAAAPIARAPKANSEPHRAPAVHKGKGQVAATRAAIASPPPERAAASDSLSNVARLADRGDLQAAARECERIIARSASAEAYCLLGVVRNASGDAAAALDCLTKALYLDRRHHDSLVLGALIHDRRGDRASADNFRRRAERLRKDGAK